MRSSGGSAQLTSVYYLADDGLKSEKNGGNWRRVESPSAMPGCRDNCGGDDAAVTLGVPV